MSRSQETQTFNTASQDSAANEKTAQSAENDEQAGIGAFQTALGKFAASNPYVQGGEMQTDTNKIAANTADANSDATKAELQQQAQRTGQNPNAANATAASLAQANERAVAGQEASADQSRVGNEAKYNADVLSATSQIPGMEGNLASIAGGQADNQLATQQRAGETPSFWDTFGNSFSGALGQGLGRLATSPPVPNS